MMICAHLFFKLGAIVGETQQNKKDMQNVTYSQEMIL